jgi:hypothetical protein
VMTDSLIRCPLFPSGASRVAGTVDLLKGRDGDRMSIGSASVLVGDIMQNLPNTHEYAS